MIFTQKGWTKGVPKLRPQRWTETDNDDQTHQQTRHYVMIFLHVNLNHHHFQVYIKHYKFKPACKFSHFLRIQEFSLRRLSESMSEKCGLNGA